MPSSKADLLARLAAKIGALERPGMAAGRPPLPFAVPAIDRLLPGGGLARGALHDVIAAPGGEGHDGAAAGFCAVLVARLMAEGRPALWCHGRHGLYGPGLAAFGLDPARLILARPWRAADTLWAMEEGLRCSGLAAVAGEIGAIGLTASRRLALAAEASGVTAILLRPSAGENAATAAMTRWQVGAAPSLEPLAADVGREPPPWSTWDVRLLRARGGRSGAWRLIWRHGALHDASDTLRPDKAVPRPSLGRNLRQIPGTDCDHGHRSLTAAAATCPPIKTGRAK